MHHSIMIQAIRLQAQKAFDEEEYLPDLYDRVEWSLTEIRSDIATGKISSDSSAEYGDVIAELEELRRLVFARIKELWPDNFYVRRPS